MRYVFLFLLLAVPASAADFTVTIPQPKVRYAQAACDAINERRGSSFTLEQCVNFWVRSIIVQRAVHEETKAAEVRAQKDVNAKAEEVRNNW